MEVEIKKYIEKNVLLEDISQLYYKLVDKNLFIVYVDIGKQREYWNDDWDWLPIVFKTYDGCAWDSNISMWITPEQEAAALNGHEDWPKSFPKLSEMSKYIDNDETDDNKIRMLEEWRNKRLGAIKKLNDEPPPKFSDDMSCEELRRIAEYYAGYEADIIAIDHVLDAIDAPHDCEESVSLAPKRIRLLGEQLQSTKAKLEEYDSLVTKIGSILTEAGIPEQYDDQNCNVIPLDQRVKMLSKHVVDLQKSVTTDQAEFLAKSLSSMDKAAFEIGKVNE